MQLGGSPIKIRQGALRLTEFTQAKASPFIGLYVVRCGLQTVVEVVKGDVMVTGDERKKPMVAKHTGVVPVDGCSHREIAPCVLVLAKHQLAEGQLDQQIKATESLTKERAESRFSAFRLVSAQPRAGLGKLFSNQICVHPTP